MCRKRTREIGKDGEKRYMPLTPDDRGQLTEKKKKII